MFTWSENPVNDMWGHIRFFGNSTNCRRLLRGEMESGRRSGYLDGAHLDKKVEQITMCINQASDFFAAAEQISINTSPLLLFYGMLSLAKALIVANKKDLFLQDVSYHGLETRPKTDVLRAYVEDPEAWEMEREYAVTNEGVFKQLTQVIDNFSFEDECVFRFKDILAVCPEISKMFEKTYSEPSKTLPLSSYRIRSGDRKGVVLAFDVSDVDEVYKRFPELENDFELVSGGANNSYRQLESKSLTDYPDYGKPCRGLIGGDHLVGAVEYELKGCRERRVVNPVLADYIAMFILSMCVRYRQEFWGGIVNGTKSGVLGLINIYIGVVKRRYPNIFLDYLAGEEFRYGTPGYYV